MIIPLAKLAEASEFKPQGYYDACIAAGTISGETLCLTDDAFNDLRRRFSPPTLIRQAVTLISSSAKECGSALSGESPVDDSEKARRLDVCHGCEYLITAEQRCSKCGCFVEVKSGFRTASCPDGRW